MNKKFCIFSMLLLIFVSGCNKSDYKLIYTKNADNPEQEEIKMKQEYTIVVIPKVDNIPYFHAVEDGVMEASKALNVDVIYEGPTVADAKKQIEIIEKYIQAKVDVIAISANDPEKLTPVLKKARDQGIKVITWDADTSLEARDYFIDMVDSEVLGRHLMDTLAWNTDEKGEFAIITGSYSAANLNTWIKWIKVQQQENYPNMKLVSIVNSDDNPHQAFVAAKKLIKDYPKLTGIIGNSSVGPPAAAQAVKELNKKGKVSVVGLSPPNSMNEYLKGDYAQVATLWSPKKLGYLTVAIANNLLHDVKPYNWQEISGVGEIRVKGDTIIMGDPIDFTKENVDQYDF